MSKSPDLRVLAGYVRNRLKRGETASFRAKGAEFFISRLPFDRLLVATDKGESAFIEARHRIDFHTFAAKGFRLQRAIFAARLFASIRAKTDAAETASKPRMDRREPDISRRGTLLGEDRKRSEDRQANRG